MTDDIGKMVAVAALALITMKASDFICERHGRMAEEASFFDYESFVAQTVKAVMQDDRIVRECWDEEHGAANVTRLPDVLKSHSPLCEYVSGEDFAHIWGHAVGMGCSLGQQLN